MCEEWKTGRVVASVEDAVRVEYKGGVAKWFKAYSDKVATHKSHVGNKPAMLYGIFKKYI